MYLYLHLAAVYQRLWLFEHQAAPGAQDFDLRQMRIKYQKQLCIHTSKLYILVDLVNRNKPLVDTKGLPLNDGSGRTQHIICGANF